MESPNMKESLKSHITFLLVLLLGLLVAYLMAKDVSQSSWGAGGFWLIVLSFFKIIICAFHQLLKNNILTPNRNLSSFWQFFVKEKRSILSSMQKFGEMCITT